MVNKKKNYLCESGIEKSVHRDHRFGDPRDRLVMSIGDPLSLSHTQDRFLLHVHEKKFVPRIPGSTIASVAVGGLD